MNNILRYSGLVALVILAIMGGSYLILIGGSQSAGVGTAVDCGQTTCFTTVGILTSLQVDGTTIYNGLASFLSGGLKVGSSGTTLTKVIGTTCNLIGTDASLAASSSKAYDCAVTGVTASDKIIAQLASSTPAGAGLCPGWLITASKASSTSGFVTVLLANNTCTAAVPSVTAVGSSTVIWAFQ